MTRAGRLRRAIVAMTVLGLGAAGCGGGDASVEVRMDGGELRLTFDPACRIAFLRLADGSTAVWEIRGDEDAAPLGTVTAGVAPAGYTEVTDVLSRDLPAELNLSVKTEGWFGATIDMTTLGDDSRRLELSPVMNELSPAGEPC